MEQWIKRLGSGLCATLLTVTLNTGVFADVSEDDHADDPLLPFSDVPADEDDDLVGEEDDFIDKDDDLTDKDDLTNEDVNLIGEDDEFSGEDNNSSENLNDPSEDTNSLSDDSKDPPEGLTDSLEDNAVVTANLNSVAAGMAFAASPDDSDQSSDDGKNRSGDDDPAPQTDPRLVIGTEEINLSSEAGGNGWSYDASEGWVYLNGYEDENGLIGTAGRNLTLKLSGLNRIGTLVVDGNLTLIGSGILLVDSIQLAEGMEFNLQTNSVVYGNDASCSVAVFLWGSYETVNPDGTTTTSCAYNLINGSSNMTGILDEDCTIPEGLTLRIPSGSDLQLQSVSRLISYGTTFDDEGNPSFAETTTYSTDPNYEDDLRVGRKTTAPCLTISETAHLIIELGSNISFHGIHVKGNSFGLHDNTPSYLDYLPSIKVLGQLTLNASLQGARVQFGSSAVVDGNGFLQDSTVLVSGNRSDALSSLSVQDSVISLQDSGANLNDLTVSGTSTLVYSGDSSIGSMTMASGSRLNVENNAAYGRESTLSFTGLVKSLDSGGVIVPKSGIVSFENGSQRERVIVSAKYQNESGITPYAVELDDDGNITALCTVYDYTGNLTASDSPRVASGLLKSDPSAPIPAEITDYYDNKGSSSGLRGYRSYYNGSEDLGTYPVSSADNLLNYTALKDYYVQMGVISDIWQTFLLETEEGGRYGYVVLDSSDDEPVSAAIVTRIRILRRHADPAQGGGGSASDSVTVYTGNGALGQGAGSITGGSSSTVFTGSGIQTLLPPVNTGSNDPDPGTDDPVPADPDPSEKPSEEGETDKPRSGIALPVADVWVEVVAEETFVLHAAEGDKTLVKYGGQVSAVMNYSVPDRYAGKPLYAVFRDANGILRAFRANYDASSGKLSFRSDCLGRFVIIGFDYEGEELSDAFFEALELWISQNQLI